MRLPILAVVASSFVLSLGGCQSKPSESASFAFMVDCPDGNWERCRRRRNAADRASIESFNNVFQTSFDRAWPHSPSYGQLPRKAFDLMIVRDPLSAFMFETYRRTSGGREVRVIRTSSETFATIAKIAIARRIAHVEGLGERWFTNYLLYMRSTPDGGEIVDPLRASGLIQKDAKVTQGVPNFIDLYREGINDTYWIITFLVAHELFHLDNPFECDPKKPDCGPLHRQHEADADQFAFQVLANIGAKDNNVEYNLAVPVLVFMQLMLTSEGARSQIDADSHPPDHERLRSTAQALLAWLEGGGQKFKTDELRGFAQEALRIVGLVDAEGPKAYFAGIDDEAKEVSLAGLQVFGKQ